jgi:transposase
MQRGRDALDVFCTRAADLLWLDVVYVFGDSASSKWCSRLAAFACNGWPGLVSDTTTMNRKAAAIDVGSEKMHVGIAGQDTVKVFDCFTDDLRRLRDHLKAEQVTTVAMEATGVYWLPVFQILEAASLEVCVVNGAHVKNVPGRKTDTQDCQWLAQLHSQGLLGAGFVPPAQIRRLRSYVRLRQDHVSMGSTHILHMQKALDLMNLKIHDVLSQTIGVSCLKMIRAMVQGERNPAALIELCEVDVVRRKEKQLLRALEGTWDEEHLFALQQALQGWDFYQSQIEACDVAIGKTLQQLASQKPEPPEGQPPTKKRHKGNAPIVADMDDLLHRLTGADLSALPCITPYSQMLVLSEIGTDMSRWPTEKHFVSWLGLSPGSRQSGKRRRHQKRFRGAAGKIFCVIARTIGRSRYLALTGFYRRIKACRGGQIANIACARKIAILFYNALKHGVHYVEQGLNEYEKRYREQSIKRLKKTAAIFGLRLEEQPLA